MKKEQGDKKMRGSPYYCSRQLAKGVFAPHSKKIDRINSNSIYHNCISSYETFATYVAIWDNLFLFLREKFDLKNVEYIKSEHIKFYLYSKLEKYSSKKYFQKIVAALGKLEFALNRYSLEKYPEKRNIVYDFSIRLEIYKLANSLDLFLDNQRSRAYENSYELIENLGEFEHKLVAKIQLSGGARFKGIGVIKESQLKGYVYDVIEKKEFGIIETKEKGGRTGNVFIEIDDYEYLSEYLYHKKVLKIDYQKYEKDLRQACKKLKIICHGTHGFRYCFCQRRLIAYQNAKYSYIDSLKAVSQEMKHNRIDVIEGCYGR